MQRENQVNDYFILIKMKLLAQHSTNVNNQGQPPEKKPRVGVYGNADPSTFDYQVNPTHIV